MLQRNIIFLLVSIMFWIPATFIRAMDQVTFTSGQTVSCRVLEYRAGNLRVIDEDGVERTTSIDRVETIVFDQPSEVERDSSPRTPEPTRDEHGDKVYSVSEVLAGVEELKGQSVTIEGNVEETDSAFGVASGDNFVIVLRGGLRVQIETDYFRKRYFDLKNLRQNPHPDWHTRPFFDMRISQGGRSIILVEKRQEHGRYSAGRWRYRESIVDTRSIMDSGESIRIEGTVRKRGRRVYIDDTRLLKLD